MATPNRAAYLTALLNQKKQNEYQGGNVVNQGSSDQISETGSQSHSDGKNMFQKVMGGIDNIGYRMGKGLFSFLEGFADLGANAIGALGDVTGWYDSKPYTDWAKHDMSDQAMKWAMTYGDMNPISIGKKAVEGKYVDGDYWGNLWGDLGNIFTGQDDGKFEEDFKKNYQYDFDDNFMTNNGVGQFVGDMAESFGRMVPSIALGKFAGGIAEKAALKAGNIIGAAEKAEKVGKLVSTAMIGVSSAGSSSVEALNDGANAGKALLYGLASGAVEAGTEYIPWERAPGLGKLIGKNTLPGIGLRKFSISELGKSMAQEGLEEVVSGVFNPILKTIYKGADSLKEFGNKDFYIDLGKSFASGALMGGLMEGVSMKANSSKYSNEGIDYINKGTEWYGEYMKEVDAFSKLDGRYANGEINSIQYEDGCEEIAGKLKEISQKGEEIGKLWDKIPEGKKDAVREFFSDPQKYAEEMRETTNRVEMDSNKPIGNVGGVQGQTQTQPSNNVANGAQSQGNVVNDLGAETLNSSPFQILSDSNGNVSLMFEGKNYEINFNDIKIDGKIVRDANSEPLFEIAEKFNAKAKDSFNDVKSNLFEGIAEKYNLKLELADLNGNRMDDPGIKSVSSFADRLYRNYKEKGNLNPNAVKDMIRGVYVFDENSKLPENIASLLDDMQSQGYEIKKLDAKNGSLYKGIHLNLSKDGVNVEIQLHTPDSWKLKLQGDVFYDKYRSVDTSKLVGEEKAKYIEATKKAVSNGSKYLDEKTYRDVYDLIPDLAKSLEERGLDSQSISPVIGRDVFTKTPLTNSPSHGANKSTTLPSGNFTNSRSDIRNSSIDNDINISQNVANDIQNQGDVENGQTKSYNGSYEDDFARLQDTSRELLKKFENSGTTYQELDEGVRERYTRGIQEKLGREINSNPNVHESSLKSQSKGTEFKIYSNVSSETFHDAFETIKPYVQQNEMVDLHDDYSNCKNYLSSDGLQGFSIDPDGNLISVFNADAGKRGYIDAIKDFVKQQGATHLDCYGYLAKLYSEKFGFKIASEMDYNMEYDHHGIAERFDKPSVSFLVKSDADVETKHFGKDDYDAAKAYQMSFVKENESNETKNSASSQTQVNGDGGNSENNGNGESHNGKQKNVSDTYQSPSTPDERTKAYRKAEETYQSNQQLLKDAAPNKKVNLKTATDYANAEASLVESYLNSNVDSDISVKFSSRVEQGKKYSAGVDTSLSRDSAISTLDAQFEDSLKNATVKQRGGETQKLADFVDSETLDEIRGIAHSLHEQLVDGADDSKIAKTREMFERKTAYLRERLSNTIDMAKEVDRFNKNSELTKRQFKIDQSKYADESAADGTIRQIAKSLPSYNILLKDGRRASDNSGLSLAKKSYAKWANDAYATLKGIYDNGQLVNFDAERADALFGDLDLIANGGDQSSKSMTLEQVKAMTRVMKALRFQISDQANKKRVELRSKATSLNSEVSYMNEAFGKDPGKANGRIRAFANEQVKLSNAGDILMGYDGSGLQKEMDAVVESKWKYYDDYYAMKEKYLPDKSAEIKSLTKELSSKVTINGEKVTKGEVLDAYLMLSDAETKSLMDNARKTDTRKIRIGKATMAYDPSSTYEELGKILGDDLIERGKKVFTSFYNDHSENSYLNKLRDYQLKTSGDTTVSDNKTDYYPRGQASESTTRTNSIEALEKNASGITAKNGNVTKARQAAQAMVVLEATDPFTRMQDYMSQVSSEMNLRNQSNDFLRLLGLNVTGEDGKTTRLQSSLGAEGTRMLRDFITAANGNDLVRSDALLTKMQALSVNATLGFSPINPMKNFLSLFKEGHEVGFSNVMKVIANPTKWVNKELIGAIKNTGVWKARYDDVASMAANADLKGKIGKIGQKMTALYSTFDQATSLMVAQVDLEYVKSAHPEMSASEQIKEAVRLWQEDVNKTQSTAEKMSKSQSSLGRFMGGDSQIAKGLWTFQSDTVAGASMLVKDISQFQSSSKLIKWAKGVIAGANASEAKVSYAKDVLAKATATRNSIIKRRLPAGVAATLIGACLKYLIEDLSQRVRGKKKWDESPIDGDMVADVLNNGLGSVVPFYETIMSAMKYNEGKVELYGLSALSSLLKGLGEFGKGTPRTALIDTVTAASSLAGIPLKNIYDYTVGAFSSFDPRLAVDTNNLLYASEKASTSYKSNFDMALYERVGDVSDDVKVEMRTLSDSGYDIKPSGVATTYKNDKGDDVTISWTSKQEMRKYYQRANAKLAKTVKTDYYRSLSDEEKAQAIKKLYSSYREASLAKVVTKKIPTNAASALAYANYKDLGTLLSAVAHISSLEATKTMSRKQRAIAYVNSLKGLSKAQRMAILQMAGYTVDSKYLGQLLRESGMDNKTIKEVTSA